MKLPHIIPTPPISINLKWHNIMDEVGPENESVIIQVDYPRDNAYAGDFKKHYTMGMRQYRFRLPHAEYLDYLAKSGYRHDFWWIYAKDFPFPDKDK